MSNTLRPPGRVVIVVILVVLVKIPAQQLQPVIDGLVGLVGLAAAWDTMGARVLPTPAR